MFGNHDIEFDLLEIMKNILFNFFNQEMWQIKSSCQTSPGCQIQEVFTWWLSDQNWVYWELRRERFMLG